MAVSSALPLMLDLRDSDRRVICPFSFFQGFRQRLRKVSYLAVSVRLTAKQVWVNECVMQYDWSMIFKEPIKRCNT